MDEKKLIKNIEFATILKLDTLVDYEAGRVVSRTLSQGQNLSLTLFAFDKGEEISTHSAGGDAMVYILDGESRISIDEMTYDLKKGETIIMPKNIPHGLKATERFKMLLIVVFKTD